MKFILEYVGTAAKADGFGGVETVEIEGTIDVVAPIKDYGRIAAIAKRKNMVFKQLRAKDKTYRGVLKLAKKKLTLVCPKAEIDEWMAEGYEINKQFILSKGGERGANQGDILEFQAEKARLEREEKILREMWKAPTSNAKK